MTSCMTCEQFTVGVGGCKEKAGLTMSEDWL